MSSGSSLRWDPANLHFRFEIPNQRQRLKDLMIYVSNSCLDDSKYSNVKLLKILFFSDFEAYGRYGTPITGMPYRRLPFGPAPADYETIQQEMVRDRLIRIVDSKVYDLSRQRVLPLTEPKLEVFSGNEIAIVAKWIREFWGMSAKRVSEYSHSKAPWRLARKSELIPYEAVFISDEPVTYEDVDRVKELAARYGWKL
jgi:uncharacterized phage-associated protein